MKTLLYPPALFILCATNTSFKKAAVINTRFTTRNTYSIIIVKNKYELQIYDSTGEWLVTYPVVFGNSDQGDKMMQGDRKTPEGIFHIISKRKHEKWDHFMMLDYPTQESYARFNQRRLSGLIPSGAEIGGGIGIHGTWPHEEFAIDHYQNWTEGCISTKNVYIQELFDLLPVGTKVTIKR